MAKAPISLHGSSERHAHVARVIEEIASRRAAGEPIRDDSVLSQHADLLPELDEALRNLRFVEALRDAERAAADTRLASPAQPAVLPPPDFPGYRLTGEAHRGGQGIVYRAVQTATKRDVALKVLHSGPVSDRHEQARFDREVQILGQLRHPNIVTIHECGSASGRAFFVMDYVEGRPLDEYVATVRLSPRETMRLLREIALALSAAHLRGIIHRDLKPSNIRVDDGGKPHILDFGLAKLSRLDSFPQDGSALARPSGTCSIPAETAPMTETGQFVGSLPWASPEQLSGPAHLLDIRSDVYSIGVILFRLLTGQFPYAVLGPVREVVDNILHAEPDRPRRLRPELDDEAEAIVLACLEKSPERRYQSAGELAADIQRYLDGEPIAAKRHSGWYVFRKQLRRHRVPIAVASGFVLLLFAGLLTSLALWERAEQEKRIAQKNRAEAETVVTLLSDMLASAAPDAAQGADFTVRQMLDDFERELGDRLADHPDVEATVRTTIGNAYRALGEYAKARPHLARALELRQQLVGTSHEQFAQSQLHMGWLELDEGRFPEAETLFRAAFDAQQRLFGKGDARLAPTLGALGNVFGLQGQAQEAEHHLLQCLAIYRSTGPVERIADTLHNLAKHHADVGDYAHAEPLLAEALALQTDTRGETHPSTLTVMSALGVVRMLRGDYARAEPLLNRALDLRRTVLGEDHPHVAASLSNLGSLLVRRGERAAAEPMLRDALAVARRSLKPNHPGLADCLTALGSLLTDLGALAEAETVLREALEIRQAVLGAQHVSTSECAHNLARVMLRAGRAAEAQALVEAILRRLRAVSPNAHPREARSLHLLASILRAQGMDQEAEAAYLDAISQARRLLGDSHPDLAAMMHDLADFLLRRGQSERAEPLYRELLPIWRATLPGDHRRVADALHNVGLCRLEQRDWSGAEQALREGLGMRERDHAAPLISFTTARLLAVALCGQGRTTEADAVLREAYARLDDSDASPQEVQEALARVVSLYEDWMQFSLAQQWRDRLYGRAAVSSQPSGRG